MKVRENYYILKCLNRFSIFLKGSCGGYLNDTEGTFTSPNYPGSYGNNRKCLWIIQAPRYHTIKLTFENFDVEGGFDSVEVFDGKPSTSKIIGKYSGNISIGTINSTGSLMTVALLSDSSKSTSGFWAKYKASKLNFHKLNSISHKIV